MSVKEVEAVINELVRGFSANDVKGVASLLSDNLEVFDHVPYRFDNKKQFVDFLTAAMAPFKDIQFGFRQLAKVPGQLLSCVAPREKRVGLGKSDLGETVHQLRTGEGFGQ